MTDIMIPAAAHARIGAVLEDRHPDVRVILWSPNGLGLADGAPVSSDEIAPRVGWISADILADRQIDPYCSALLRFPSVQWLQSANAGLDHPVYARLAAAGVRLSKSSAQSIPIAEYVLGYALAHFQNFEERRRNAAAGTWKAARFRELWHATWLIVGFGHIGRGVAVRAQAFESRVIATRRDQTPDPAADVVTTLAELPGHLPDADIVVLACPATAETVGLADQRFFAAMKPGALLLNVARGALVDEAALVKGLAAQRPGHAVLDVFEKEPLPAASPLWRHPQVTVTAHTSNAGNGTRQRGDRLFLDNLGRFLAGHPIRDEVHPSEIVD